MPYAIHAVRQRCIDFASSAPAARRLRELCRVLLSRGPSAHSRRDELAFRGDGPETGGRVPRPELASDRQRAAAPAEVAHGLDRVSGLVSRVRHEHADPLRQLCPGISPTNCRAIAARSWAIPGQPPGPVLSSAPLLETAMAAGALSATDTWQQVQAKGAAGSQTTDPGWLGRTHSCLRRAPGRRAAGRLPYWTAFPRAGRRLVRGSAGRASCGRLLGSGMRSNSFAAGLHETENRAQRTESMNVLMPGWLMICAPGLPDPSRAACDPRADAVIGR